MHHLTDKALGQCLLVGTIGSLLYYVVWVIISPFIDATHALQSYFPERKYAILVPTVAFVSILSIVGAFVGLVMVKSGRKSA